MPGVQMRGLLLGSSSALLCSALPLQHIFNKGKNNEQRMCVKNRMESKMCKDGRKIQSQETSFLSNGVYPGAAILRDTGHPALRDVAGTTVLKTLKDACSHCRMYQCSPGLCYAGKCPQGSPIPSAPDACQGTDYCWNPAPVSVAQEEFKNCFEDGSHGLGFTIDSDFRVRAPEHSDPPVNRAEESRKRYFEQYNTPPVGYAYPPSQPPNQMGAGPAPWDLQMNRKSNNGGPGFGGPGTGVGGGANINVNVGNFPLQGGAPSPPPQMNSGPMGNGGPYMPDQNNFHQSAPPQQIGQAPSMQQQFPSPMQQHPPPMQQQFPSMMQQHPAPMQQQFPSSPMMR